MYRRHEQLWRVFITWQERKSRDRVDNSCCRNDERTSRKSELNSETNFFVLIYIISINMYIVILSDGNGRFGLISVRTSTVCIISFILLIKYNYNKIYSNSEISVERVGSWLARASLDVEIGNLGRGVLEMTQTGYEGHLPLGNKASLSGERTSIWLSRHSSASTMTRSTSISDFVYGKVFYPAARPFNYVDEEHHALRCERWRNFKHHHEEGRQQSSGDTAFIVRIELL